MDFDNISNQELIQVRYLLVNFDLLLFQALTERGVTVGGINATTRNLYVRKLKNLLAAGDVQLNGGGDNGRIYDDDFEVTFCN